MTNRKLSVRQQTFAEQYLVDFNATCAAVRAGYARRTARSAGARLLHHKGVSAYIDQLRQEKVAVIEENRGNQIVFYQTVKAKAMETGNLSVALRAAQRLDKLMDYENLQGEWRKQQSETAVENWDNLTDAEVHTLYILKLKLRGEFDKIAEEEEAFRLVEEFRALKNEPDTPARE